MNKRLFSYVILALLFLSLIPLFPSVGATLLSFNVNGAGDYDDIVGDWNGIVAVGGAVVGDTGSNTWKYLLGTVTDHTTQAGTITNVNINARVRQSVNPGQGDGKVILKTGGTEYEGASFSIDYISSAWWYHSNDWANNPGGGAWTWAQIDAIQIGVRLKNDAFGDQTQCDYVVMNVTYTPSLSVTTSSVASVTETTATFNGVTTGADDMTCGFWYNTTGTNTNTTCAGTYNNGIAFSKDVTGLKPGYYYNVTAWSYKSGIGMFFSSTVLHFLAKPYAPSLPHSVASGNNITISWTNFTKAASTTRYSMVRYSTVAYPTTIASGTLLINTTTVNTTSINYYTPGTYYFSYWTFVYQGTYNAWSTTYNTSILVAPTKPSNLAVTSFTNNSIYLSWTKGTGNTTVTRNATAYPTAPDNGVKIYNSTLEVFNDTGLLPSHKYYYRAWNWNGTAYSPGYTNVSQYTRPNKPYNLGFHISSGNSINITWLNGTGSQRTVIRESTAAQPLLPTDGTLLYNGTLHYKVDTSITGSYYTLFSYNITTNLYSAYAPLSWYAVIINCYNESSGLTIAGYNVFFTNPDGTDTYEATGCTNPYLVNVSDIPLGASISILVNATGYYSRTYVKNIVISGNYYFSAYLIPLSTATLYYLRVVETIETGYTQVDQAVEGATLTVKRYINATVGYQTVSTLLTDANGYVNLQLLANIQYKVFISKTGYDDKISDYIPAPPNEWGQTVEKWFRIIKSTTTPDYNITYGFWDLITFNAVMYLNNTIKVTFIDNDFNTTNAQFYTYELYNFTSILISMNTTLNDIFIFWIQNINSSRTHQINIYLNQTTLGYQYLSILVLPVNHTGGLNVTDIENKITAVLGSFALGFVKFLLVYIPAILLLILPGKKHPGFGIIASGLWMGFAAIKLPGAMPSVLYLLAPFVIAIGIILMMVKEGGVKL